MMKKLILLFGLLALASVSCIKEEGKQENLLPIDSGVNIRLIEAFDTSPRTLHLYCSTEKIYGCSNFPIIAQSRQSSNTIEISFKGFIKTDFCLKSLGPARTTIDLGALSVGTYTLSLSVGEKTQTGKLIVSDDSYKVDFDDSPTFSFTNPLLNRIPEQTIWGYVGYDQQEEFLTALTNLGAEEKPFLPGDYREFQIDENGEVVQSDGPERDHYFVLHYAGDLAAIDAMMKQYATKYKGEYVYTAVYTDTGERFLSWMY